MGNSEPVVPNAPSITQRLPEMTALMPDTSPKYAVLLPVLDDWTSVCGLLPALDLAMNEGGYQVDGYIVDDGSTRPFSVTEFSWDSLAALRSLTLIRLSQNVGHQRAIAIGLSYLYSKSHYDGVLVMDADGEDRPQDAVRLLHEFELHNGTSIVFAQRAKRSEGIWFRFLYYAYRLLFRALTGRVIQMGNFSVVPYSLVRRLVGASELWNHYVAAVVKGRMPYLSIPSERGRRIDGRSQMNYVALVTHGLSAISVFADDVAARSLIASTLLTVLAVVAMGAVATIRLATAIAIPGWATNAFGFAAIVFLQAVTLSVVFAFLVLSERNKPGFLPLRDFEHFVYSVEGARNGASLKQRLTD
jgi:hypothetical protein